MFQSLFRNLSPVVKNLLIINGIFYLAQLAIPGFTDYFSLYYPESSQFRAYQIATHFFMHSQVTFMHIIFNMFALVMFGPQIERVLGAKRFLSYYFITAFGAAFLHQLVNWIQIQQFVDSVDGETLEMIKSTGYDLLAEGRNWSDPTVGKLNHLYNTPVLGASGAVFGLLAAFAYYFPNTKLMLLFPPIPIKAKFFVLGYAAIELFSGISNSPGDNVAHFAHLGGALFGIIMMLIWKKDTSRFY